MKTRLLLFDIDGTLLVSGGVGVRALRSAMIDCFGRDDSLANEEMAGRTDSSIAGQLFKRNGIEPSPENLARFFDSYLHHLAVGLPSSSGRILPGILALLRRLREKPEVALGLLTGNIERGAKLKLAHYGILEFFEFGAFADDHHDRNQLGHFARDRALKLHGVDFPPERIYILGDTPHDIHCGRALRAQTVAIATGHHSRQELAGHQPDYLFDDLSDTEGFLATLGL